MYAQREAEESDNLGAIIAANGRAEDRAEERSEIVKSLLQNGVPLTLIRKSLGIYNADLEKQTS